MMCMKYEQEYTACFDHLFLNVLHDSWIAILKEHYGLEITNENEMEKLLFKALEIAHEKEIIKPKQDTH